MSMIGIVSCVIIPAVAELLLSSLLFLPGRDAKYCDERVCLSVCPLTYPKNYSAELRQIFCPRRVCYPHSVTAGTTTSVPTKFCLTTKTARTDRGLRTGVKSALHGCLDGGMESTTAATEGAGGNRTTQDDGGLSCPREEESSGCVLYSFIVCTVIIGLLAVFGSIGNVVSFVVFHRDKIKTSTTFLFQVVNVYLSVRWKAAVDGG